MSRFRIGAISLCLVACGVDQPTPTTPTTAEAADALFVTTSTCDADVAGYRVKVTYPASWFTADACTWFNPDPPEPGAGGELQPGAISFGAVPAAPLQGAEPTSGAVDGRSWIRVHETTSDDGISVRYIVYYVTLNVVAGEPTMVAATSTAATGDHELNAAVLDRLVERFDFED